MTSTASVVGASPRGVRVFDGSLGDNSRRSDSLGRPGTEVSECSIPSTENGLARSTDDAGSGMFRWHIPKGAAIVLLGAILTLFGCSNGTVCVDECGPLEECLDGECVPLADCETSSRNACGGCEALAGAPGDACGDACGVFACSGTDSVVCLDLGPNECGITAIDPPVEYSSSRAQGINNLGHVTGYYHNVDEEDAEVERKAYVWNSTSQALLLPTLSGNSGGWAINDSGLVSGYSTNADGSRRSVMWDSTLSTIIDVGTLESTTPGNSSDGHGINNHGLMVGMADVAAAPWDAIIFHAFCYDQTAGIRDLGTLTSEGADFSNGYSYAYGVNDLGDIVGLAKAFVAEAWVYLAFIHDDVQGMRTLPVDPTTTGGLWYATVINDAGLIGGHWADPDSRSIPYYWANSSATPVRLEMPEQFPNGEIYGINSSGVIVGMMYGEGEDAPERAFAFNVQTGVVDLQDLLHPDSDWILRFARDINDVGQVVGTGTLDGVKRGFVLDIP